MITSLCLGIFTPAVCTKDGERMVQKGASLCLLNTVKLTALPTTKAPYNHQSLLQLLLPFFFFSLGRFSQNNSLPKWLI